MKTGRNEPCPCGSGKKFKKCCGLAAVEVTAAATDAPAVPTEPATPAAPKAGRLRVKTWVPMQHQAEELWPSRMTRKKPG